MEGKRSERRGQEQEVQKRLERDGEMAFAERTDLHCDCGMGIKGFFSEVQLMLLRDRWGRN